MTGEVVRRPAGKHSFIIPYLSPCRRLSGRLAGCDRQEASVCGGGRQRDINIHTAPEQLVGLTYGRSDSQPQREVLTGEIQG